MSVPSAPPTEPEVTAPEVPQPETESPPTEVEETAAPEPAEEPAAEQPKVEVTEPEKPDYMTRAEWEREKAEVAQRAAAEAIELERRRRQTENARRANQERRDAEERLELQDTIKAAFAAKGVFEVPDDAITAAIDRSVRRKAEGFHAAALDNVEQAWDYLTSNAYGKDVDLPEEAEAAAKRLYPKLQDLINTIRPAIEAKAREGYIAESDLPKRVDAEIARRAAQAREKGPDELKRPAGDAGAAQESDIDRIDRISKGQERPGDAEWWAERQARRGN